MNPNKILFIIIALYFVGAAIVFALQQQEVQERRAESSFYTEREYSKHKPFIPLIAFLLLTLIGIAIHKLLKYAHSKLRTTITS